MTAQVVRLPERNELGYPVVICSNCEGNKFHVVTHQRENGTWVWQWLICSDCGSQIPVCMEPVWAPEGGG